MKVWLKRGLLILVILIIAILVIVLPQKLPIATGFAAKNMCSCVFIADRNPDHIQETDLAFSLIKYTRSEVNYEEESVTTKLMGGFERKARFRNGIGCSLVNDKAPNELKLFSNQVCDEEMQADSLDTNLDSLVWQSDMQIDLDRLKKLVTTHFDTPGGDIRYRTRAVVLMYQGKLIFEHYADGFNAETPQLGWSMSKSLTSAIAGIMVKDGLISIDDPVGLAEWQNDERKELKIRNLLQMDNGLHWEEMYGDASDVTDMLYKASSKSAYAIDQPLEYPIGTHWNYSSGTSNILAHVLRKKLGSLNDYICYARERLFHPIGAHSMVMEADQGGDIVGSSYTYATPRDWAKFGQLYLQDGVWEGERILPVDWVDYTRQVVPPSKGAYGAHFWLNANGYFPSAPKSMYSANGFQGQRVFILPTHDLVIARLGVSPDGSFDFDAMLKDILSCFESK